MILTQVTGVFSSNGTTLAVGGLSAGYTGDGTFFTILMGLSSKTSGGLELTDFCRRRRGILNFSCRTCND